MYNAKPLIASALTGDAQLVAMVPAAHMFDGIAVFNESPEYPYITMEELGNNEEMHADDTEIESSVIFRVHIWHRSSVSAIAGHVNRIMRSIGFGRNYALDQDERLDTGEIIKHKIMSFSGTFAA